MTESWSEPAATGRAGWGGGDTDRAGTRSGGEEVAWNGGMRAGEE